MAILPIRGKILNVERLGGRLEKMFQNTEVQALISAIGAGVGEGNFDAEKNAVPQRSFCSVTQMLMEATSGHFS